MKHLEFFGSKWVRFVAFLWMVAIPLLFIFYPVASMASSGNWTNPTPIIALAIWLAGPWLARNFLRRWMENKN